MTRRSKGSSKTPRRSASSRNSTRERLQDTWKALARRRFWFFCQYSHFGKWHLAPHLELICSELEEVEAGRLDRLILTVPPRHGKSMSVTETFPAWYLGRNPEKRVIEASYSDDLARTFGDKCRRKIEVFGPELWGLEIDRRRADKSDWGIKDHNGGMVSAGIGGSLTGRGADLLIIDDPVKNRQEADSQTYRDRVWSEWQSTLSTRLHPKAVVVVVLTRWHEDDLAGRLIKAEPNRWKLLNLPAIAEENDPLGRPVGAALWPERYDEAELAGIKITAGSRDWEALYQGRPSPLQGGLFKRQMFRRFKYHPEKRIVELFSDSGTKMYSLADCKVFQTCDVAGSLKSSADYFVLGTFALAPAGELLILDIFRDRLEGPDQPALLQRKFREWSPVVQGIESKSMGLTLYQSMIRSGLPILELTPGTKDKYTRALSMAPRYQAGMVYHRQGAPWADELETELASFPSGAHDDQVDVVVYAGDVMEWVLGNAPSGAGAYVID